MKNLFGIIFAVLLLFLLPTFSSAQVGEDGLPDISSVDSIRVIKLKVNPTDTVRKIRFVTISYQPNPVGGFDTLRSNGVLHDSLQLLQRVFNRIYNENMQAAALTREAYKNNQKAKGQDQYRRFFRRISGQDYHQATWDEFKASFLGTWNLANSTTSHSFTVSETAGGASRARRNLPVPAGQTRFDGQLRIICENRLELVNYFTAGQVITLDAIAPGVFMSLDGQTFISKAAN